MKNKKELILFLVFASINLAYAQQETSSMPEKKVMEIILAQDESGSMDTSDPLGIRTSAVSILKENLELAGKGHTLGFFIFATSVTSIISPSENYEEAEKKARETPPNCLGETVSCNSYTTIFKTPFRMYTDFYRALQMGFELLKNSPPTVTVDGKEMKKEKIFIILTDGRIDPWPGDSRFRDVASQYLEKIRELSSGKVRYEEGERCCKGRVENMERGFIREKLNMFRDNEWKIYAIGFSGGTDPSTLQELANSTFGEYAIARTYEELYQILEKILPRPENVVVLSVHDFCNTTSVAKRFDIGNEIKSVLFKINFGDAIKQKLPLPRKDEITIRIVSPSGQVYPKKDSGMNFHLTRNNEVFAASLRVDKPEAGIWNINVDSKRVICGKLSARGKQEQEAIIQLNPSYEIFPQNSEVEIITYLQKPKGEKILLRDVKGKIFVPSAGPRDISFTLAPDRLDARGRVTLSSPGKYMVVAELTDERYGNTVKAEKEKGKEEMDRELPELKKEAEEFYERIKEKVPEMAEGVRKYIDELFADIKKEE